MGRCRKTLAIAPTGVGKNQNPMGNAVKNDLSPYLTVIFFPTFVRVGMLSFVSIPSGKPLDVLRYSDKNVGVRLIMNI